MTAILIATLINSVSVRATGSVATIFTFVKVFVVLGVGFCAFFFSDGSWLHYALSGQGGTCEITLHPHEADLEESARR